MGDARAGARQIYRHFDPLTAVGLASGDHLMGDTRAGCPAPLIKHT